ncbi:MAG TPA: hypothetical protein PKJ63_01470 [Cyclobacteriaceae bacterium]|nr:hypothetical protein [Cyclobacteriaceae bacterium]
MIKLEPGYYKIQRIDYAETYGRKHARSNPNQIHILYVKREKQGLTLYLDHNTSSISPDSLTGYEVISRFEKEPIISKCNITISFQDSSGIKYSWSMSDMWVLRNVLVFLPWLRKPFGFTPRKKNH